MNRLVLVSGASRGIGAAAAIEFNNAYETNTHLVIMARDLLKLNQVKKQIDEVNSTTRPSNNTVALVQVDFSSTSLKLNDYVEGLKGGLPSNVVYDELIVIYNHGTLEHGPILRMAQEHDGEDLHKKFEANFFSCWYLLAAVQSLYPNIQRQYHININSSYAINAAPNWSAQCCARTSRQMLFKCLALEQPAVRVLNYEPGVVYTDMTKYCYETPDIFPEQFKRDYEEGGKFVTAESTMRNLVNTIKEDKFASGSCETYAYYKLN